MRDVPALSDVYGRIQWDIPFGIHLLISVADRYRHSDQTFPRKVSSGSGSDLAMTQLADF